MFRGALCVLLMPMAAAQPATPSDPTIQISTSKRGHVKAKAGEVILEADRGALDSERGRLELAGHARVTLPARSDRNLIRYGARAAVSEEAVVIGADRFSLKDGLLTGRGHIVIKTEACRLQADEIVVYLRLGDGELHGNIRCNGTPIQMLDPPPAVRRVPTMPPEIIRE